MAHTINFSLLVLCFITIFFLTTGVDPVTSRQPRATTYYMNQCKSTRYPNLCVKCLSTYGNKSTLQGPKQLAQITLAVALVKARYTKAYVSIVTKKFIGAKAKDSLVVKECLDHISDGVDQLAQSIKELQKIGEGGEGKFIWHVSNIQSWTSAAITDSTSCIDGFSGYVVGGKVKATIKARVLNVAQLTSNALALFNRFATKHRSSHAYKLP